MWRHLQIRDIFILETSKIVATFPLLNKQNNNMSSSEESDINMGSTPPDILNEAQIAENGLLPPKSRERYIMTYNNFNYILYCFLANVLKNIVWHTCGNWYLQTRDYGKPSTSFRAYIRLLVCKNQLTALVS